MLGFMGNIYQHNSFKSTHLRCRNSHASGKRAKRFFKVLDKLFQVLRKFFNRLGDLLQFFIRVNQNVQESHDYPTIVSMRVMRATTSFSRGKHLQCFFQSIKTFTGNPFDMHDIHGVLRATSYIRLKVKNIQPSFI